MAGNIISTFPVPWSVADVLRQLGDLPPGRICAVPAPGLATEGDLVGAESRTGRMCELIDGVLVEKPVGYLESMLALVLARAVGDFVQAHDLGIVLGADGPVRILPGQVRVPDVSFVGWERFPGRVLPREPILSVVPDLVIEVLSDGNTAGEMSRKLDDYFRAGVRLVWYVDLRALRVEVYTGREQRVDVDVSGFLDGFDILPGWRISVADLFSNVPKQ